MSEGESTEQAAPIGVAVRRTGLSADVIRAWERRHGAIVPERSESGRRLYSERDLIRLERLKTLVDAGWPIGRLASLPDTELEERARQAAGPATRTSPPASTAPPGLRGSLDTEATLEAALDAIRQLDARRLREELERAAVQMSRIRLLEDVLGPLLVRIGTLCYDGDLRTVHEHLASAEVRSFVGTMHGAHRDPAQVPRIVVTTPAGQIHEFGALMVAAMAGAEAWDVTYLGPDLPAEEIAAAIELKQADAVALSITVPGRHGIVHEELRRLRRAIGPSVRIILGGQANARYTAVTEEIHAVRIASLQELRRALAEAAPED